MAVNPSLRGATDASLHRHLSPFQSTAAESEVMIYDGLRGRGRGRGMLYPKPNLPQHDSFAAAVNALVYCLPYVDAQSDMGVTNHHEQPPQAEDILSSSADETEDAEINSPAVESLPAVDAVKPAEKPKKATKKPPGSKRSNRTIGSSGVKEYTEDVREDDILCGRGGRSNHHAGNKKYRQVVNEMKMKYKSTEGKLAKTDLSKAIVDYVFNYGGRFLKKDGDGRYYVLTPKEARRKTSQALREAKDLKWLS